MDPRFFAETILYPGLDILAAETGIPPKRAAARFLLAIALQESKLLHRYQIGSRPDRPGPARGWWQFERGGGVHGVLTHKATKKAAAAWCRFCRVNPEEHAVWRALEGHDLLAVGFARLLVWTSPQALPQTEQSAWVQYAHELWRPGKPHPATWPEHWRTADATCR